MTTLMRFVTLGVILAGHVSTVPLSFSQPLRLEEPRRLSNGEIEIKAIGVSGPKQIEFSNDFLVWEPIGALEVEPSIRLVDNPPLGGEPRFFRVRSPRSSESDFSADAVALSSSAIKLIWAPLQEAEEIRIFLAPEPELTGIEGPARRLVHVLPGTAIEVTVTNLAPAVEYFWEIDGITAVGNLRARVRSRIPRTPKARPGPKVVLQPSIREVHGFAPNILCVTLANWPISEIKTQWRVVRANGTEIPIVSIHRHSVPVGAPEYPLGQGMPNSPEPVIEIDHRIFIVLGEAIGSPSLLDIYGPSGLQCILPFSDIYLETPVVQLNQVGFNPRASRRWAYISGWMGDGGPLSLQGFSSTVDVLAESSDPASRREVVLSGLPLRRQPGIDNDAGTEVADVDLSGVPKSESKRYRIRLPGVGVSWSTEVSERSVFKSFFTVLRGLLHNRWGGDLKPQVTEWSRSPDHTNDVFTTDSPNWSGINDQFPFQESDPRQGPRRLQGGHHDAGDFDIRPMHSKVAQLLLRAYEITPESFKDGQLLLPEDVPHRNGIPDLLDEALWSVRGWEELQEGDGGVRLGVESFAHPQGVAFLASEDELPYWTFGTDANHTARVAGLFAQAARLVAPFAPLRSASLRERAERAYDFAVKRSADPETLIYAASELYRLTLNERFRDSFVASWDALDIAYPPRRYGIIQRLAPNQFDLDDYNPRESPESPRRVPMDYVLGLVSEPPPGWRVGVPEFDIIEKAHEEVHVRALAEAQRTVDRSGHRSGRPSPWHFAWGTGTVTQRYLDLVYARLQLGDLPPSEHQLLFDALSLCADYVLGGNPNGLVYFTSLGTRPVEQPLHTDSLAFLQLRPDQGPMPGIPVYGPYGTEDRHGYDDAAFDAFYPRFEELPPGRRFGDVRLLVPQSEFTVWEVQAPHAQLFAVLLQGGSVQMPPLSYRPGGPRHRSHLP